VAADLARPAPRPTRLGTSTCCSAAGTAKQVLNDTTAKAPDYAPAWLLSQVAFAEGKLDESAKAVRGC
jgi:hypothetical protein